MNAATRRAPTAINQEVPNMSIPCMIKTFGENEAPI
jgi:hypothetical protein